MNNEKKQLFAGVASFNIGMIFLLRLWPAISAELCKDENKKTYNEYRKFFGSECYNSNRYNEWIDAILIVKGFSLNDRGNKYKELIKQLFYYSPRDGWDDPNLPTPINIDELFLITVEFCKIMNTLDKSTMLSLFDYLEAMQKHKEKYFSSWEIWQNVISDVISESKYICEDFFWNYGIFPGQFEVYEPELQRMIEALISNPNNKVGHAGSPHYDRDVYLKNLSKRIQIWAYVETDKKNPNKRIIDCGINTSKEGYFTWWEDERHEHGGCFVATISSDEKKRNER